MEGRYRESACTGITLVPLYGKGATLAAGLAPLTRAFGISLVDRACLAMALQQGVAAITANEAWSTPNRPIQVPVIRRGAPP